MSENMNLQTYVVQCTTCGILATLNIKDTRKPYGRRLARFLDKGRLHRQENPDHLVQLVVTYQITEPPGVNG